MGSSGGVNLTKSLISADHMYVDAPPLSQITNGSPLSITLRGSGAEPQVSLSSTDYDFGPCFLHRADMSTQRATITITNNDRKDIR